MLLKPVDFQVFTLLDLSAELHAVNHDLLPFAPVTQLFLDFLPHLHGPFPVSFLAQSLSPAIS